MKPIVTVKLLCMCVYKSLYYECRYVRVHNYAIESVCIINSIVLFSVNTHNIDNPRCCLLFIKNVVCDFHSVQ